MGRGWREVRWRSRTQVFVERIGGLELPLVRIPAGHFWMGSPAEEPERLDSEGLRLLQRRFSCGLPPPGPFP